MPEASRQRSSSNSQETEDGEEELSLILEVVDILDEVKILLLLLETQTGVLNSLRGKMLQFKPEPKQPEPGDAHGATFSFGTSEVNGLWIETAQTDRSTFLFDTALINGLNISSKDTKIEGIPKLIEGKAGDFMQDATKRLRMTRSGLERIHAEASQTQRMILELLDLEQKAASLREARLTTMQGKAIMLFTVVTIVFLPLSFITSFLGQNVTDITGDENNPTSGQVWKIAGKNFIPSYIYLH
ncbi:hypothetical protein FOBRF1_000037 [Fusarium oxysporum]